MGVLSGVRVLDLTRVVAGPWATQVLADLGAEVIKIERPGEGDDTRRMGPFVKNADGSDSNDSAFYLACNRGKRSVTIDISQPEGQALIHQLAEQCDVLVENYKVGSLARYGLDAASMRARFPRLIYCSVTGFGSDGPYAARPAYDFILQGLSGLMSTCGHPDGEPGAGPMRTAIPITDIVTGLYASISILGALIQRGQTGEGQFIDAAMLDSAVALNGHLALGYLLTGKLPARIGNANPVAAPSEIYATRDGRLILAVGNNGQFSALLDAIGLNELAADPRFASNYERVRNRSAMYAALAPALLARDTGDWMERLAAVGVPCGTVNDFAGVFADPQVRHRGLQLSVPHGHGGEIPMLRSPLNLSASPVEHRAPPLLGADTGDVLHELLGASAERIERLRERQVI